MDNNKKISIVVPCYNTGKYVVRCIESILNQTYTNFELILTNDCSPDNIPNILEEYKQKDDRIIVVNNEKNLGLFKARLAGADVSTGDYICFIDSDDYISRDYLRSLIDDLEEQDADMVFCNTVIEENNKKFLYNLFDFHKKEINGAECLKNYFTQEGVCYRWHTVWNKLYKMELWKKARKHYDEINGHLIMTEDFAFSTVLFFYSSKIVFNDYACYFYCSNDDASTSLSKPNYKKYNKNINDIFTSFEFVKKFLKRKKVFSNYQDHFNNWYKLYIKIWYDNVNNSLLTKEQKSNLINLLIEKVPNIESFEYKNELNFYNPKVVYNDRYETIIEKITNSKYDIISFDMFDTLISRPFYEPKDLFLLLDKMYQEMCTSSSLRFSDIRVKAEKMCRKYIFENYCYEEVTLDEIYDYIEKNYRIESEILKKLKKEEIKLELKFCKARKSGLNLYKLAKSLNKRIIITSDIYLPRVVIEGILKNTGYSKIDRIYLSCEEKLSKSTKALFKIVISQEGNDPSKILHIGDNYTSDYENPQILNIDSEHLIKATDAINPYLKRIFSANHATIDFDQYLVYGGLRNSIGLVANKFFDNPYCSFDSNSEFNCNPEMIGYFALGMHMFDLGLWLYKKLSINSYDSITFMARDGHVLKKVFDIIQNKLSFNIKSNYVPISRNSLVTYSFETVNDYIKLIEYYEYDKTTKKDIYELLQPILKCDSDLFVNEFFNDEEEFVEFINEVVIPNIDEKKVLENRKKIREYFLNFYEGKSATFDIGYSGKPEFTLTRLLEKPIDTYFVHTNDDNGFYYSTFGDYNLNTFYDFKPRFTGILREYLFSELTGSCKSYEIKNNEVSVKYDSLDIDYYEKWVLDIIQNSALRFTEDMIEIYGEYINEINFPKFYMSIPFEFFLHNASESDRKIFCNLKFENAINDYIDINTFWADIVLQNSHLISNKVSDYNTIVNNFYAIKVNNRNKFIKILYYLFFDRVNLKAKIKQKLGPDSFISKSISKIYHIIKR